MFDVVNILGVNIAVTSVERTTACVRKWIADRTQAYVCFAPVSTLVDCQKSAPYKNIINGATMTNPDGMPVVWVARWKGRKNIQRTCGPDFMERLFEESEGAGYRHFFYGGTSESKELLLQAIKRRWPGLKIAGAIAPPFRAVGELEESTLLEEINAARADVLWVGLGSPKQDYWMANHRDKLNVPVICGVGAAFDFIAGTKPMAPGWMRSGGLEWLFRLCCEPKRLWRRYVVGNSQFIYFLITRELLKHG
ncbi:MAG: WecB/TagA/CpsF family glycosyltransferase [Candidatus Omnitrophica bacterium]|nr:WecB/TagA/CpsF family glycosyltransferase [Candidatus Omnitrophota bacterium]